MAYIVDSNVFIGAYNPKDHHHAQAANILKAIEGGEFGEVYLTDYILDEVLTFTRRRVGYEKSLEVLDSILSSSLLRVLKVEEEHFQAGILFFEKYPELSFTDAVTVAVMTSKKIPYLFSFDAGFDGIRGVTRLTQPKG